MNLLVYVHVEVSETWQMTGVERRVDKLKPHKAYTPDMPEGILGLSWHTTLLREVFLPVLRI